jgi:predicted Zn finger-like uncharacterized protein
MKITCPTCNAAYNIPNDKIPVGKRVSATCKKCAGKIVIEPKLDKVEQNNLQSEDKNKSLKDVSSTHPKFSPVKVTKPAGFWIRFVADIIDSAIIYFPLSIILPLILSFAGISSTSQSILQIIFVILISAIYYTILTGKDGWTWGEKVFDISVVNNDGTKISYIKSFLRWCSYLVSYLTLGIGFFLAGWTKDKKALHDYVAFTKVVRLKTGHKTEPKSKKKTALIVFIIILAVLGGIGMIGYVGVRLFLNKIETTNIFLEDIRTGEAIIISEKGMNTHPKFSPDGKKILYAHRLDVSGEVGTTIRVYSIPNRATTDIFYNGNFNLPLSWGPKGNKFLFSAKINGQMDLWFYSIEDKTIFQITDDEAKEEDAILSPDGEWILFIQKIEDKKEVFLMSSKGGDKKRITNTDNWLFYPKDITWSRDSQEISYFSFASIVIVNIYTGEEERLDLLGEISNQGNLLFHPTENDLLIFKAAKEEIGLKSNLYLYSRKTGILQVWKTERPLLEMFYDISPNGENLTYTR